MHLSHILELKSLLKEALGCAVGCSYDCRPGGWELQQLQQRCQLLCRRQRRAGSWAAGMSK